MSLLPSYFVVQIALAPLPQPFMEALTEIEIETSVGQASIFRLHFDLSRNIFGDFDALAIDIFRPLFPINIRLAFALGVPHDDRQRLCRRAPSSAPATVRAPRRWRWSAWTPSAPS